MTHFILWHYVDSNTNSVHSRFTVIIFQLSFVLSFVITNASVCVIIIFKFYFWFVNLYWFVKFEFVPSWCYHHLKFHSPSVLIKNKLISFSLSFMEYFNYCKVYHYKHIVKLYFKHLLPGESAVIFFMKINKNRRIIQIAVFYLCMFKNNFFIFIRQVIKIHFQYYKSI